MELPRTPNGWATLLIDPPWRFSQGLSSSPKVRGGAEKHYATMSDEEILALPIRGILAGDAQVWLWSTTAHLHRAFHCLEAWGLEYKTLAVWLKNKFGLGYWLRGQTEYVLLGVRGNPRAKFKGPHGATGLSFSTLIRGDVRRHSEKPEESYRLIEAISEEPRLEVFARRRRPNWTGWGNQLEPETSGLSGYQ